MKKLDHNAIARSVNVMGYRLENAMHKKRHEADAYKLTEVQQQYQIAVEGQAGVSAWTTANITFQEKLYYAPLQRTNKNEDPQVWWGAVLDEGQAYFSVHVKKWRLDKHGNYTGAHVAIGAHQGAYPGAGGTELTNYKGIIHITFQGLGIPIEDGGFTDSVATSPPPQAH